MRRVAAPSVGGVGATRPAGLVHPPAWKRYHVGPSRSTVTWTLCPSAARAGIVPDDVTSLNVSSVASSQTTSTSSWRDWRRVLRSRVQSTAERSSGSPDVTPRANGLAGSGGPVVVVGAVVAVDVRAVVDGAGAAVAGPVVGVGVVGVVGVVGAVVGAAASSDVQAPTTTVAPSARKVRRDSRVTGRSWPISPAPGLHAWRSTGPRFADQLTAGAAIVQLERRPPADGVADVGDLGRLDDAGRHQLDALVRTETEAGVEQALTVTEEH